MIRIDRDERFEAIRTLLHEDFAENGTAARLIVEMFRALSYIHHGAAGCRSEKAEAEQLGNADTMSRHALHLWSGHDVPRNALLDLMPNSSPFRFEGR